MKIIIKGIQENNLRTSIEGWDLEIDVVHNTISGKSYCEDENQFEELKQEIKDLINNYQDDLLEALNERFSDDYVALEENYISFSENNEEITFDFKISDLKKYDRIDVEYFRDSIKRCYNLEIENDDAEQELMTALQNGVISYREFETQLNILYTDLEAMNE